MFLIFYISSMSHSLKTHLISATLTALAAAFGYLSTVLIGMDINQWSEIAMWAFTIGYRAFLKEILIPQNENN